MAQTQVKPTTGGAWTNTTTYGKNVTGISNLAPYAQNQLIHAANVFTIAGGSGAAAQRANKIAASVGRSLQWA